MYDNSYEEYMRAVLGYSPSNGYDIYQNNYYDTRSSVTYGKLERMYPNIYFRVYPIICDECAKVRDDITEDELNKIVDKIAASLNIEQKEEKQERNVRNNYIKDLIKILFLRELLNRPQNKYFPQVRMPYEGIRPSFY